MIKVENWFLSRVIFLGDVVYVMLFFLGRGVNIVLEDGLILINKIKDYGIN